jgi:4-hydroxy-tetrahydrodipicolinate reductase
MVKIAVAGAAGRMGRRISTLAVEHPELELAGAFEMTGHNFLGVDMGELLGVKKLGVPVEDNVEAAAKDADIIIDFTAPKATLRNMEVAASMGKAMVIGTTGLSPDELAQIKAHTGKVACVQASNMSLGINLLSKVLRDVARALGDDYDVEIFEAHHKHKKDAPSGTALMLGRAVADALGRDLATDAVYCREGIIGERTQKEIGIQTIRAGDIVGEHTVWRSHTAPRVAIPLHGGPLGPPSGSRESPPGSMTCRTSWA